MSDQNTTNLMMTNQTQNGFPCGKETYSKWAKGELQAGERTQAATSEALMKRAQEIFRGSRNDFDFCMRVAKSEQEARTQQSDKVMTVIAEYDDLKAQRDELLTALKAILDSGGPLTHGLREMASAAIAEAERSAQ